MYSSLQAGSLVGTENASRQSRQEEWDKEKTGYDPRLAMTQGYDPRKPTKFITYLDANNLYAWMICKPLLIRGLHWKQTMPTVGEILAMEEDRDKG